MRVLKIAGDIVFLIPMLIIFLVKLVKYGSVNKAMENGL